VSAPRERIEEVMTEAKVLLFLGGTAAKNNWRDSFTKELVEMGFPPEGIFNPVVPDWSRESQQKEDIAKAHAWMCLFYVGSPQQEGNPVSLYSVVEAIMNLYDRPASTVVTFDFTGISGHALRAMEKTYADLKKRFPDQPIYKDRTSTLSFLMRSFEEALKASPVPNQG
jgi:hypothetical protein